MRTIERRIVAAHIVSSDNKILFGRKNLNKPAVYPDCWHIPGGGVEEGETDDQAMAREILEETGLDISNSKMILIDGKGHGEYQKDDTLVKMHFNIYKVEINKPAAEIKVEESDDLVGFKWFDLKKLGEIKMTPPAYKLFERIGTDWLRFGNTLSGKIKS